MGMGPFAYIGTQEILIVAGVVVLLFGGAKLPQLAKGLGEGIREFKKSVGTESDEPAPPGPAPTPPVAPTAAAARADADEATPVAK